jgi:hypothetical protein
LEFERSLDHLAWVAVIRDDPVKLPDERVASSISP